MDWIDVAYAPSLEPSEVTLAATFRLNTFDLPSNTKSIIRKRYLTNDNSYAMFAMIDSQKIVFSLNQGSGNSADGILYSTTTVQTGVWYFVAGTFGGSEMRLYINGVLESSMPYELPIQYDQHGLELGGVSYVWGNTNFLDGTLDDVRIFDYALSEAEIAHIDGCEGPFTAVEAVTWGSVKSLFR